MKEVVSVLVLALLVLAADVCIGLATPALTKAKVAVLGASGYTGAELMRLLHVHPNVEVRVMTSTERNAGKEFKSIFPQFSHLKNVPKLTLWEDAKQEIEDCDIAFCCLPHGTTQEIIGELCNKEKDSKVRVVDLSADFRLKDTDTYKQWYGKPHAAVELQKEAVYGLPEVDGNREKIAKSKLVANPGCYPTAAQLPLIPLLSAGMIEASDIIIDAKSGTTGAGRAAKEAFLYCEVTDGIQAYGVASHRHAPEIEQGLSQAALGVDSTDGVMVTFTPHLMPMSRGILEAIYVKLASGKTAADLKAHLHSVYDKEQFVHVLEDAILPQTRHIRGSNHCNMNVVADRIPGRAIIISAIDNLVKGASGQAIQNMNIMMGWEEGLGLQGPPMFP
jgi:N-acetyl-gamma-glutamyl-phosphate reductase